MSVTTTVDEASRPSTKVVRTPPRARIEVWSHGCKISRFDAEIRTIFIDLCRTAWGEYGTMRVGRFRVEQRIKRVYVGTVKDRSVFHFHRNQLDFVLARLAKANITEEKLEIIRHGLYQPKAVKHPAKDPRTPRPKQLPLIEYLVQAPDPQYAPSKVVTAQTGFGKGLVSLTAIREIGQRTVLVLKGMYVEKWITEIEESFGKDKGSLMVIRGMPQLRTAIAMAQSGKFKPRMIIISQKTMFMYLKYYEQHGTDDLIPVAPMDFYKTLGVGIRVIDEVHQEFHCNFRQDVYSNVPLTISMSATLDSDQPFLNTMYHVVWPHGTWAPEVEYDRFIAAKALWYRFHNLDGIKWTGFGGQYNHTEFEKSILRKPRVLESYADMIVDIMEKSFIEVMEKGQKMIIFVATVQMATYIADLISTLHPELLVNRYVAEDEYDDLLAADVSVSTILSAGTAVDIPNLRVTLMTTALSSKQSNIQVLGRTRRLKDWPDVTPEFLFLASKDVDKHRLYAKEKRDKLSGKVLSFQDLQTSYVI